MSDRSTGPLPSAPPPAVPPISLGGWLVLLMLVGASIFFFIDRQALAILKSTLAVEFALNNRDYSLLLTAYMVPYTIGYLFSGQLIDRWGTRICATLFLAGMSGAAVWCGLAGSFHELLAARIALGIAESGVVPSIYLLITKRYPQERRGFVFTMHQALQSIGPVITAPLVATLTLSHGWRSSFILPGALGFGLALIWFLVDRNGKSPASAPAAAVQPLSFLAAFKRVIRHRPFRGILLTRIVSDPAWFFLIYWHPAFLQDLGGWELAELGQWTWMMPAAAAIANVMVGSWSDRIFRRGGDAPVARSLTLRRLAWLAPCFALAPLAIGSKPLVLALLVVCYVMANCWLTLSAVLATEVAPPGMVATAIATLSALGGVTSIAFNYAAGPLIDVFGYATMFVACAGLHPLGALILHHSYGRPVDPAGRRA